MCVELTPDAREKLSDPKFILRAFIEVEEKCLEMAKSQLEKDHESEMAEKAKLPIWYQSMDAPYWLRRFNEISMREQALKKAKAELCEIEKREE